MNVRGTLTRHGHDLLFAVTGTGLAAGAVLRWTVGTEAGDAVWSLVTVIALVPAVWWVVAGLVRRRFGSDVIAVLALAGTIAVGEALAGAVIAVMLTGGQLLEERAGRRARRDLAALLSLAPRVAHRQTRAGLDTVDVGEVRPGDRLMVRSGETVPVDGQVEAGTAVLDESTLTGEPLPVERPAGDTARAGTVNAGGPFGLRATSDARSSTYAGIVRLAEEAAAENAPFVRLADRYSAIFLPLTLLLAGGAWLASGDPVRAVAVLVVATPCPLIIAAPIAFVSGLSRCARRGVVVKGGGALERLARARVLLFDKTGTVTTGRPALTEVITAEPEPGTDPLMLAASLDQVSPHVLASAIVRGATERGLALAEPSDVTETPGRGVLGTVHGHRVGVGKASWAGDADAAWLDRVRGRAAARGAITVFVGVDGRIAAVLLLQDRVRPDAARTFRLLRRTGIARTVMVTGDRADVAEPIAALVGADAVHSGLTPAGKVEVARAESARAATVMVGDGVNDAPALASAGVGVALGARGATASSEAADVVITVDRLERLAETLAIARRTRSVALQSVLVGMGASLAAMVAAAFGLLAPAAGALLQEGIDVAAILSALRVLGPGRDRAPRLHGDEADLVRRLDEEHRALWPRIERLPALADTIAASPGQDRDAATDTLRAFLTDLAAHERKDERLLYPAVARVLGGSDPTGPMSRGHTQIAELTRRVEALITELETNPASVEPADDLRRTVLELYGVLRLHFAQEEENYFVLADVHDETTR
ncbi:heavy metal-(Cd/Co/Hg/Pb/Zn)-translocating P-type ATPase [Actinomadura pelletieri DSM 43383]|uniref:Heavy metal-(Cd/Co/Hg/Pb/Zn)-translocating P-type ATPase n=1 Tax=Actinomadura pelletieri DSM 43383 TaxID=1120940 RepID=A0A495QH32_9ACTN|nr:heavy metal translocating P-type ATPase [Actinomadura pelletieri]RKS71031.1 heavy metal-(Cd/Co/Hg/Pb/Zn)-translocating P-type ATPase [Actinomadura pelletieri DSM 43383]